jgi:CheY-like chemotaxis protein
LANADPPDVMLLDVSMPGVNGFQVAQLVRKQPQLQAVLLVAVTGWGDPVHRLLWEKAFDHYLLKPVAPSVLEALLAGERDRKALCAPCRGERIHVASGKPSGE